MIHQLSYFAILVWVSSNVNELMIPSGCATGGVLKGEGPRTLTS